MVFSEQDVRAAAAFVGIEEGAATRLVDALRARGSSGEAPAGAAAAAPHRSLIKPRFDLTHVLWYMGALIVIGAMTLFTTLAFETAGGRALALIALIYAAGFLKAGDVLWRRGDERAEMKTPAGLLVTVAVAMVPLAVFGIQDALGWWGKLGDPGKYGSFFTYVRGGWLPMEIATITAALLALRRYPFPFLTFVVAMMLWFISMDLTPWIFRTPDITWQMRRTVSLWFGLAVMIAAWIVDLRRRGEADFGFWLHIAGLLAFWGGLTLAYSQSELAKFGYCLVNVALIGLSVFLGRRLYSLFGALGITAYLGHLAADVFGDSLLFPFALSALGIAIIGAGLLLNRNRPAISRWMESRLPEGLRRLRPAQVA